MLAVAPLAASPSDALSPEARRELTLAKERVKPILKAARVASFNGWTLGAIAALSAPFALFSVVGALTALALAVVAYNEFRGRQRLLAFDLGATTLLGWNQIALLVFVVAYCGWMLWTGLTDGNPLDAELRANPELSEALGSLGDVNVLYQQLVVAVYASVIVVTIGVQGLNAYYYFSRRKHMLQYLEQTPPWALETLRLSAL